MDNNKTVESLVSHSGALTHNVSTFLGVDSLYLFIFYCSVALFIAILIVSARFIWKYRKRSGYTNEGVTQITHSTKLELAWTIPPLIVCLVIFAWGFKDFLHMSVAPKGSEEIHVIGKKWMWQFQYKNGTTSIGELVVPVNTPITLVMSSEDVIHSFYLPNFRVKRDVLPNRYTRVWFEATKTGTFQVFCTEFCGDGHSDMLAVIRVVPNAEYRKWVADGGSVGGDDMPLDKLGEKLAQAKGCAACHSIDGSQKVGPTWKGLFGSSRKFVDGGGVVADENYIRESIEKPHLHVVAGYGPVMPVYAGLLKERELAGLVEYIKSLK